MWINEKVQGEIGDFERKGSLRFKVLKVKNTFGCRKASLAISLSDHEKKIPNPSVIKIQVFYLILTGLAPKIENERSYG